MILSCHSILRASFFVGFFLLDAVFVSILRCCAGVAPLSMLGMFVVFVVASFGDVRNWVELRWDWFGIVSYVGVNVISGVLTCICPFSSKFRVSRVDSSNVLLNIEVSC